MSRILSASGAPPTREALAAAGAACNACALEAANAWRWLTGQEAAAAIPAFFARLDQVLGATRAALGPVEHHFAGAGLVSWGGVPAASYHRAALRVTEDLAHRAGEVLWRADPGHPFWTADVSRFLPTRRRKLRDAILALARPLEALPLMELGEGIRLEQARAAGPAGAPGAAPPATPRLQIAGDRVLLDGKPVVLDMTERSRGAALCFLGHLLAAGGNWRTKAELDDREMTGPCRLDHDDVRWGRIRDRLPPCLHALVQSGHKGYRLAPQAWHE
jgi:hypothetical protein